jgi:hypothetical protein
MSTKKTASTESASEPGEKYIPAEGSWVAELEEAQADLDDLRKSCAAAAKQRRRGAALKVHVRLCRAYQMLRQWKKLEEAAAQGLEVCDSYRAAEADIEPCNGGVAARLLAWFRSYRERARRELSTSSSVDAPEWPEVCAALLSREAISPDALYRPIEVFPNSNLLQYSALVGDVRLLEAMSASGAAIDHPFLGEKDGDTTHEFPIVAPTEAKALVMLCATLAASAELDRREPPSLPAQEHTKERVEYATMLVNLGADPTRKINWSQASVTDTSWEYQGFGLDGLSALELAKLAGQRELVELMERHT